MKPTVTVDLVSTERIRTFMANAECDYAYSFFSDRTPGTYTYVSHPNTHTHANTQATDLKAHTNYRLILHAHTLKPKMAVRVDQYSNC
jgi:hypothetical protein